MIPRRAPSATGGDVLAVILAAVGIFAFAVVVNATLIMVVWGAIAGALGLPTIGFGTAFLVGFLSSILFGMVRATR